MRDATPQRGRIALPIPAEKDFLRTKYTADAVNGDSFVVATDKEIAPKFILNQEQRHRMNQTEEAQDVTRSVKRQIAHDVRSVVVLAHLIAGG